MGTQGAGRRRAWAAGIGALTLAALSWAYAALGRVKLASEPVARPTEETLLRAPSPREETRWVYAGSEASLFEGRAVAHARDGDLWVLFAGERLVRPATRRRPAQVRRFAGVARFSPDGAKRWERRFEDGRLSLEPAALVTTPDGGGWVAANMRALGEAGSDAAFLLARLDAGGERVEWLPFRGESAHVRALALGPDGTLWLAGDVEGAVALGRFHLTGIAAGTPFLAALHPSGEVRWAGVVGEGVKGQLRALAVDARGQVSGAGALWGSGRLGGRRVALPAMTPFFAQWRPDGALAWANWLRGGSGLAHALAVDDGGQLTIAGEFDVSFEYADTPCFSMGLGDAFVVAAGPNGEELWARHFGTLGPDAATALTLDAAGNAVVAALTDGEALLGEARVGGDLTNLVVARLARDGGWPSSLFVANSTDGHVGGVAAGRDGLVLTGSFAEPTDFGLGRLQRPHRAPFVVKLAP